MVDSKVTVCGAYWCPDCRRSKKFLGEQFIPDKDGEGAAASISIREFSRRS